MTKGIAAKTNTIKKYDALNPSSKTFRTSDKNKHFLFTLSGGSKHFISPPPTPRLSVTTRARRHGAARRGTKTHTSKTRRVVRRATETISKAAESHPGWEVLDGSSGRVPSHRQTRTVITSALSIRL